MPRRRYPLTLADYPHGYQPAETLDHCEAIHATPVGHSPGESKRYRVGKDSPRIARLVAEIDEAETFRRTYIRPLPKGDGPR